MYKKSSEKKILKLIFEIKSLNSYEMNKYIYIYTCRMETNLYRHILRTPNQFNNKKKKNILHVCMYILDDSLNGKKSSWNAQCSKCVE